MVTIRSWHEYLHYASKITCEMQAIGKAPNSRLFRMRSAEWENLGCSRGGKRKRAGLFTLLRLVFDTAALRGRRLVVRWKKNSRRNCSGCCGRGSAFATRLRRDRRPLSGKARALQPTSFCYAARRSQYRTRLRLRGRRGRSIENQGGPGGWNRGGLVLKS